MTILIISVLDLVPAAVCEHGARVAQRDGGHLRPAQRAPRLAEDEMAGSRRRVADDDREQVQEGRHVSQPPRLPLHGCRWIPHDGTLSKKPIVIN